LKYFFLILENANKSTKGGRKSIFECLFFFHLAAM
jgi:hypothetical protein